MLDRLLAPLVGLVFVFVLFVAAIQPREASAPAPHGLEPERIHWSFSGPLGGGVLGTYDNQQLQRGFQVYKEVCAACHSLNLVAFRNLQEIGFSEAEVKAIAKGYDVPSLNPDTGEAATRKGLPSDKFPGPYPNEIAARAANNNALPPDLSLIAKSRDGGPDYIHSLLTGYDEKARPKGFETPEGLHFNKYFANLNIAMPPPLSSEGQVTYNDGTKASVEQMSEDVSAFLMWAAEPKMTARKQAGVAIIAFLSILAVLAFLTYKHVWADVKGGHGDPHPAE